VRNDVFNCKSTPKLVLLFVVVVHFTQHTAANFQFVFMWLFRIASKNLHPQNTLFQSSRGCFKIKSNVESLFHHYAPSPKIAMNNRIFPFNKILRSYSSVTSQKKSSKSRTVKKVQKKQKNTLTDSLIEQAKQKGSCAVTSDFLLKSFHSTHFCFLFRSGKQASRSCSSVRTSRKAQSQASQHTLQLGLSLHNFGRQRTCGTSVSTLFQILSFEKIRRHLQ
jgi:hypothetical protein